MSELLKRHLARFLRLRAPSPEGAEVLAEKEAQGGPPEAPGLLRVAELELVQDGSTLTFRTAWGAQLFQLPARADGHIRQIPTRRSGRPALLLKVPVRQGQRLFDVDITRLALGAPPHQGGMTCVQASLRRGSPGRRHLDFTFESGQVQLLYGIELDEALEPGGFQELAGQRPALEGVPPISQMVAFLRATLHQRRTALKTLLGLTRRCSEPRIREVVDSMAEALSQGQDFPDAQASALHQLLRERGSPVYVNTATAMTLLVDIHRGLLGPGQLEDLLDYEIPLDISPRSARAVAEFLGLHLEEAEAQARLGPHEEGWREDLAFLDTVVSRRNALTILHDLIEDGGSLGTRLRFEGILARLDSAPLTGNDELEALRRYLLERGRGVHQDTLAALCLFVDLEAGLLSEEDLEELEESRGFADHSFYALQAIAGAFEEPLTCLQLEVSPRETFLETLNSLSAVARGGVIARFCKPGRAGSQCRHGTDPRSLLEAMEEGLAPTGEVLLQLPVLAQVEGASLDALIALGLPLLGSYQGDDRSWVWRRASLWDRDERIEAITGPFGFILGYRAYRFRHRVVGWLEPRTAEQMLGAERVLVAFTDARGAQEYRYFPRIESMDSLHRPSGMSMVWSGAVVVLPDLGSLPPVLREASHEELLYRAKDPEPGQATLNRVWSGLTGYLTDPELRIPPESGMAALDRARRLLRSPAMRSLLIGTVDASTRNSAVALLGSEGSAPTLQMGALEPLMLALEMPETEEYAALALLYALCSAPQIRISRRRRFVRWGAFLDLLQDRLITLAGSNNPAVRSVAFRLMATAPLALSEARRQACAYLLNRHLDDPYVGGEASWALCALALARGVPPSAPLEVLSEVAAPAPGSSAELQELTADLRSWLSVEASSAAEIPPRANLKGEERKLRALASLISRVNETFRQDGSLDRERLLAVLSPADEHRLRRELYLAWNDWASEAGWDLLQALGPEQQREFRGWLARRGQASQPEALTLFRLAPGLGLSIRDERGAPQPLFLKLASLFPATGGEDEPTLVLLPPGVELGGGDPALASVHDLDLGTCEVFRGGATSWVPFFHRALIQGMGLPWADQLRVEALGQSYRELTPPARRGEGEEAPPVWAPEEGVTLKDLAEDLGEYFNVPGRMQPSLWMMLVGHLTQTRRPLPAAGRPPQPPHESGEG